MLTAEALTSLLDEPEGPSLDWKRDWPPGLVQKADKALRDAGKATLLKDLVALANGDANGLAYLVIGVVDEGPQRVVTGLSSHWDDATFQTWAANVFDPPPLFRYHEIVTGGNATVGVFEIERSADYPHVVVQRVADVVYEGQVYYRRGSQNAIAFLPELRRMIRGNEPFKIGNLGDPELQRITAFYAEQGDRVVLPRMSEKDSKLARGFRIAYFPGSRREVWAGEHQGRYEHILLIAPPSQS